VAGQARAYIHLVGGRGSDGPQPEVAPGEGIMPDTALALVERYVRSDRTVGVFAALCEHAATWARREPILAPLLRYTVLDAADFADALARLLARRLGAAEAGQEDLLALAREVLAADPRIAAAAAADLDASTDRNPASPEHLTPFLYFKGFHAVQWHRIGHRLWLDGRRALASFLQSRVSEVFGVDIHPAARIGHGVFVDHGTGVVIGETAVVGNDVSILQGVTLGGTGKDSGDRHPKVRDGVLIGAGANILGNIEIGEGSKIGAGSVVLSPVPPHRTAVGVPARIVGCCDDPCPGQSMDHSLPDGVFDYVI
jgi:serine O-acetyltransferase